MGAGGDLDEETGARFTKSTASDGGGHIRDQPGGGQHQFHINPVAAYRIGEACAVGMVAKRAPVAAGLCICQNFVLINCVHDLWPNSPGRGAATASQPQRTDPPGSARVVDEQGNSPDCRQIGDYDHPVHLFVDIFFRHMGRA